MFDWFGKNKDNELIHECCQYAFLAMAEQISEYLATYEDSNLEKIWEIYNIDDFVSGYCLGIVTFYLQVNPDTKHLKSRKILEQAAISTSNLLKIGGHQFDVIAAIRRQSKAYLMGFRIGTREEYNKHKSMLFWMQNRGKYCGVSFILYNILNWNSSFFHLEIVEKFGMDADFAFYREALGEMRLNHI